MSTGKASVINSGCQLNIPPVSFPFMLICTSQCTRLPFNHHEWACLKLYALSSFEPQSKSHTKSQSSINEPFSRNPIRVLMRKSNAPGRRVSKTQGGA